jgi:hypothetical protein
MANHRKYDQLPSFTRAQKQVMRARMKSKALYTDNPESCHIWIGATSGSGYAIIGDVRTRGKRPINVHELSLILDGRPRPNVFCFDGSHEWQAHHSCTAPNCVNANHLSWLPAKWHSAEHARLRRGQKTT